MILELTTTRRRSAISLTPLIDVVFILLLFFMLASDFSQERSLAISSQSTESSAVVDTELTRALVRLEEVNNIFLDGTSYTQGRFLDTLSAQFANDPEIAVAVSVSDKVDVQGLLDLISLMKSIGIVKISMGGVTDP